MRVFETAHHSRVQPGQLALFLSCIAEMQLASHFMRGPTKKWLVRQAGRHRQEQRIWYAVAVVREVVSVGEMDIRLVRGHRVDKAISPTLPTQQKVHMCISRSNEYTTDPCMTA